MSKDLRFETLQPHAGYSPDPSSLLERANQALYQAKSEGRNRTCVWNSADTESKLSTAKL